MSRRFVTVFGAFLALLSLALPSVGESNPKNPGDASRPSYELPQPQRENLDLNMYQLIRQEG